VALARHALDADLHVTATRDPDELAAWLESRIDGYEVAVVVGGDGTLGVAVNLAARRGGPVLGYVPAGFGNATAHLLRLSRDPDRLVPVLVRAAARPVDLVEVDGRLALFVGLGWDATVAQRYTAAGARRLPGWISAVARSAPDLWRPARVEVRADAWTIHRGALEMLVVGTTPFYGRGLRVNPGARADAGRLSIRVYPGPPARLLAEAGRWALGMRPRASRVDATTVEVRTLDERPIPAQADGDAIGARGAWTLGLRPAAVRLIGDW
jgi:diacylglycerol kinase family enzyme